MIGGISYMPNRALSLDVHVPFADVFATPSYRHFSDSTGVFFRDPVLSYMLYSSLRSSLMFSLNS